MKRLVELEYAASIKAAKRAVDRGASYVWGVLEEGTIVDHPVLLKNRAPTLRLSGHPGLRALCRSKGKAIKLHPLVCTAFNADFDGDQMAADAPAGQRSPGRGCACACCPPTTSSRRLHGRPADHSYSGHDRWVSTSSPRFAMASRARAAFRERQGRARRVRGCVRAVDVRARRLCRATCDMQIAKWFSDFETVKAWRALRNEHRPHSVQQRAACATTNSSTTLSTTKEIGRRIERVLEPLRRFPICLPFWTA